MGNALVDVVERLLEYSGSHVLLFLVLVQDFHQHLVDKCTKKVLMLVRCTSKKHFRGVVKAAALQLHWSSYLLSRNCIFLEEKFSKLCILFGCVPWASIPGRFNTVNVIVKYVCTNLSEMLREQSLDFYLSNSRAKMWRAHFLHFHHGSSVRSSSSTCIVSCTDQGQQCQLAENLNLHVSEAEQFVRSDCQC